MCFGAEMAKIVATIMSLSGTMKNTYSKCTNNLNTLFDTFFGLILLFIQLFLKKT